MLQNRDQLKSALEPFGQVMYVDYPDGAEEYVDNDDVVVDLFDFDVDFAEVLCDLRRVKAPRLPWKRLLMVNVVRCLLF